MWPPVSVISSFPEPPVIVLPLVPLVNVKFADEFVPLMVAIEFGSAANIPNVPDPSKFKAVSALPEFSKTIKLSLALVMFAVAVPVHRNIDKNISIRIRTCGQYHQLLNSVK